MNKLSTEIWQEQFKKTVQSAIYADGLKNVSKCNLAKCIGMSKGNTFRYFASKHNINLAIINNLQNDFIGSLQNIENSDKKLKERLNESLSQ